MAENKPVGWTTFQKQTFVHNNKEFEYVPISVRNPVLFPPILFPSLKNEPATAFLTRVQEWLQLQEKDTQMYMISPQEVLGKTDGIKGESTNMDAVFEGKASLLLFDEEDENDNGTVVEFFKSEEEAKERGRKRRKTKKNQ